ncbi:MAG: hypothetical protein Q7S40_09095 [Opitutaceae bacterium]|nr:hypothetical protein [Opitutaceae bacterium]
MNTPPAEGRPITLSSLLWLGVLATNAVLLAILVLRPPAPAIAAPPSAPPLPVISVNTDATNVAGVLAALSTGDSATLTAAGVSLDVVRQLRAVRAFARFLALARGGGDGNPEGTDYWRNLAPPRHAQRAEYEVAERELEAAVTAAFGELSLFKSPDTRHAFLSAAKRDQIRRIESDYAEMEQEISRLSGGIELESDREKKRLLERGKARDIDAALTPAERVQAELRVSTSAQSVIHSFGDIIASEEEFRALWNLQREFDERYRISGKRTAEELSAQTRAQRELEDRFRDIVGNDRWAAVLRGSDDDFRTLRTLSARLGLPEATPEQVQALRANCGAQAVAINQDPFLSPHQRSAQLVDLAVRAKAELHLKLGSEAATAYIHQSQWVSLLQSGNAFTTDARQLPAGTARPTGNSSGVYQLPAKTPK